MGKRAFLSGPVKIGMLVIICAHGTATAHPRSNDAIPTTSSPGPRQLSLIGLDRIALGYLAARWIADAAGKVLLPYARTRIEPRCVQGSQYFERMRGAQGEAILFEGRLVSRPPIGGPEIVHPEGRNDQFEEFVALSARLQKVLLLRCRCASFYWSDFLGQCREAAERIRTKGRADRDIRRITTSGDQHAADARDVVARIKGVPLATEIGFEPG